MLETIFADLVQLRNIIDNDSLLNNDNYVNPQ